MTWYSFVLLFIALVSCKYDATANRQEKTTLSNKNQPALQRTPGRRVIHVFVALCDNKYQGIVPVPKAIGNGQDPANNLYWGCDYGIKTFFRKSDRWNLIETIKEPEIHVPERCIFKYKEEDVWIVADAFDGRYIKNCTDQFLKSCAGETSDSVVLKNGNKIFCGGSADLLAYIGHDGLMDFALEENHTASDTLKREAIILACLSREYFVSHLRPTKAYPLLWTTSLMAPEAYTLHAAIEDWISHKTPEQIRNAAAAAYSKYQHCAFKAAHNLLVTGW